MNCGYGEYKFQVGQCRMIISREPIRGHGQLVVGWVETWEIDGRLILNLQTNTGTLDQQIIALQEAFSVDGKDFVLFQNDGVTPTQHAMLNSASLGGIRVKVWPGYPTNEGAEYVTMRGFKLVVTGEFSLAGMEFAYMKFIEKLTFDGGGPIVGFLTCAVGAPEPQTLRQQTTFTAIQEGSAVGYLNRPDPPEPIWPLFLTKAPKVEFDSAEKVGNVYKDFPITWRYEFEATVPMLGTPTQV